MTIAEKRKAIGAFCDSREDCKQCPLENFDGHCFGTFTATDKEVERNYRYLFDSKKVPLCMVGDTVYQTDGIRIYEFTVKKLIFDTDFIAFDGSAIGKSVFLTREDAEKALKERVKDD